jgi:hypothetical protein
MRKMKLRIEDLAVDSFEVVAAAMRRAGTVHGRVDGADAAAVDTTVQGNPTCLIGVCTCWYTCQGCTGADMASCVCPVEVAGPIDAARAG